MRASRRFNFARCASPDELRLMLGLGQDSAGFASLHQWLCREIDARFGALLTPPEGPRGRLYEAAAYSVVGGGKRLRPLLVLTSAGVFGVGREHALPAAMAVECVHAHSLIHDDLPCMDDDELRRGKPTLHIAYDEATAVLAGDALLALAFELLASPDAHPDGEVRARLVCGLARSAGMAGMAGGQMIDVQAPEMTLDLEGVAHLQRLKTGALLAWSVEAGALLGGASDEEREALASYSRCLGLAFQIADDLLDEIGCEQRVGKKLRKDVSAGKRTFVTLLGEAEARSAAQELVGDAKRHLERFGAVAAPLHAIADFAIARDR